MSLKEAIKKWIIEKLGGFYINTERNRWLLDKQNRNKLVKFMCSKEHEGEEVVFKIKTKDQTEAKAILTVTDVQVNNEEKCKQIYNNLIKQNES